jgi:patched 1 protein/patched 2 protein
MFFIKANNSFHLMSLGWGGAVHTTVGVFVAVLIFQFSITISLLISAVLLMVDLEVYGFMYIIGAKLNCKRQFSSSLHICFTIPVIF